ncbi:hypothetical protein SASPL_104858 [Salvia splendens]|uniref:RING-CH-type domain-containing protein n=1 Tax=Salvia splendens TaxID=180675 RepID=A0A8X8YNJ9_SALSN|nr:uncharacterized protein LOC121765265 [Salvia splendens]KAG6433250.1 hypothetical protein SASPL_104858 [Salvia splendens]
MQSLQEPSNADSESAADSDNVGGLGKVAIEVVAVAENGNGGEERRESSVSECSVEIGAKIERDCRICHLRMDATDQGSGFPIELGCSCKEDLAAAHNQCAEAWFKIKGDKTCEICGSLAINVVGVTEAELTESWNETADTAAAAAASAASQSRNFWQGRRFLNFLLACMVFAFVISWLFHFNVPS